MGYWSDATKFTTEKHGTVAAKPITFRTWIGDKDWEGTKLYLSLQPGAGIGGSVLTPPQIRLLTNACLVALGIDAEVVER